MSDKAFIGFENHVETGVVSAGSQSPAHPVQNLPRPQAAYTWRSAGTTSEHIDIDAGVAADWQLLCLFKTNLTPAATVRWTVGTAQGAGDAADSGTMGAGVAPGYGQSIVILDGVAVGRWARVRIDDPDNPDGYLAVGLAYAGVGRQPLRNLAWGFQSGRAGKNVETETKGAQKYYDLGPQPRVLPFRLPALSEEERWGWADALDMHARLGGNVLVIPRPGSPHVGREAIYGTLEAPSGGGLFTHRRFGRVGVELRVREAE